MSVELDNLLILLFILSLVDFLSGKRSPSFQIPWIQKYKIIHGKVDRFIFIHVFRNNNRVYGEEGLLTEDEGRSMDLQICKHTLLLEANLLLAESTFAFY